METIRRPKPVTSWQMLQQVAGIETLRICSLLNIVNAIIKYGKAYGTQYLIGTWKQFNRFCVIC